MKNQSLLSAALTFLQGAVAPEPEHQSKHFRAFDNVRDVLRENVPSSLAQIDSIEYDEESFKIRLQWSVTAYGKEQNVTLQKRVDFRLYDENREPCPSILDFELKLFLKSWREEARQLYKHAQTVADEAIV